MTCKKCSYIFSFWGRDCSVCLKQWISRNMLHTILVQELRRPFIYVYCKLAVCVAGKNGESWPLLDCNKNKRINIKCHLFLITCFKSTNAKTIQLHIHTMNNTTHTVFSLGTLNIMCSLFFQYFLFTLCMLLFKCSGSVRVFKRLIILFRNKWHFKY